MRIPKYISPSAMRKFYDSRDDYYMDYISDNRMPRMAQTQPMSVGSAFDAYIKAYLAEKYLGKTEKFAFEKLFEDQVEPHNRTWAMDAGKRVFDIYKSTGALADLMRELDKASVPPRFELKLQANVKHMNNVSGVEILGIPDIFFITNGGTHIILDFKVNGYCGKSATSPHKGYMLLRDTGKLSARHLLSHKDFVAGNFQGMVYNTGQNLEITNPEWATQMILYAWILGEPIGSELMAGIEQIVSWGLNYADPPALRVASHRALIGKEFQMHVWGQCCVMWQAIQSGHIFLEMNREKSDTQCKKLDLATGAFQGNDGALAQFAR